MKQRLNEIIISFFTVSIGSIKSGSLKLTVDGVEFARTYFKKGSIVVNVIDTTPIKKLRKIIELPLNVKEVLSFFSKLKNLAEMFKREKISIIFKWKDKELFILGEEAKPKLKHLLGTDAIEIKNLKDLLFFIKEIA